MLRWDGGGVARSDAAERAAWTKVEIMSVKDYTFDLHRIFVGDLPALFYAEVLLRTTIMFLFALVLIRTMGKRSLSKFSAFDFVIIIALGSAVGDPMLYDDVPLFYGMLVVTAVVVMERILALLTKRYRRIEAFVDSTPTVLIRGGVVDERALAGELISERELEQALRTNGVGRMDDVEVAILEPSGQLSVRESPVESEVDRLWMVPRKKR